MLTSIQFHKDFAALRLSTNEVGVAGLRLSPVLSVEAMDAMLVEHKNPQFSWRAFSPAKIDFSLERESDYAFIVHVEANIELVCTCVRCLNDLTYDVPLSFSIRMLEMEHLGLDEETAFGWKSAVIEMTDEDGEENDEDDDLVGYFAKRVLDLGIIVRDQIFLLVPDYPHCGMSKDALHASRCKDLSATAVETDRMKDNPFVKKFGKTNC